MAAPVLVPADDFDPYDSHRTVDLADQGLADYCAGVTIDADGVEHYALLKYNLGEADYLPPNWRHIAPHEVLS